MIKENKKNFVMRLNNVNLQFIFRLEYLSTSVTLEFISLSWCDLTMWIFNSVPWFHLVKKGSHQCRGAFFTDSNELDPAVMTERSDPKRKWQNFFILTVSTGQETVSALSRSPMQCRIGLTFSTARKRCRNFSFLGRSHLAGRCVIWHKSSELSTMISL